MRSNETIEVKQNLSIIARERGKIVARRDGHNIWLDTGRQYLAQLLAYSSFSPLATVRDDRIRYMGLGIGGNRQQMLSVANSAPLVTPYPGSNAQTDSTPTVTQLERPVRISGGSSAYPGTGGDIWIGQIQAPPTYPVASQVRFSRIFTSAEVSYGTFLSVPVSEIGLYTGAAVPGTYNNVMVAYDTFDAISKTSAFELEINWTIRF